MFYFRGDWRVACSKLWWSRLLNTLLLLMDFDYYLDFPESSSCGAVLTLLPALAKTDSQVICLNKIKFFYFLGYHFTPASYL